MAVSNVYGNGLNSTAGANTVVHYYDRMGIKAANATNIYGQWADVKSMPTNMGKTFKISRFEHMYDRSTADVDFAAKGFMTSRTADEVSTALTNAALAEGAGAVNKRTLKKVTFETSLNRYGEMIDYTDEVDIFSEDYIQVRYRQELGELANSRQEDLIQLDMLGTGTVMYSGDATSMSTIGVTNGVNYRISYDLVKAGVRKLVRNRAKKNTSVVTGSNKIGTLPVASAFYAVIGADVRADLEACTRGTVANNGITEYMFIPLHKYAAAGTVVDGEIGQMHEVKFIEAERAVVYAGEGAPVAAGVNDMYANDGTKLNVYPILFPTEGAFATIGLKGHDKIKFLSKSPEQVENGNPYGTTGFFSYNFFYAGIILREECLLKMLVGASI